MYVRGRGCGRGCDRGDVTGGCAWQGACTCVARGCMAGETATAAGGTHPSGMHSCFVHYQQLILVSAVLVLWIVDVESLFLCQMLRDMINIRMELLKKKPKK